MKEAQPSVDDLYQGAPFPTTVLEKSTSYFGQTISWEYNIIEMLARKQVQMADWATMFRIDK